MADNGAAPVVVGLISDTHGMLRPELYTVLDGVSMLLHAGDVGDDDILDRLETIAPVHAVRGNTDATDRSRLPDSRDLEIDGVRIHLSHGHEVGAPTPAKLLEAYDADVIVFGHTHRPLIARASDGRLVVNPGSAGARRFDLRPSVARMTIVSGRAEVVLLPL